MVAQLGASLTHVDLHLAEVGANDALRLEQLVDLGGRVGMVATVVPMDSGLHDDRRQGEDAADDGDVDRGHAQPAGIRSAAVRPDWYRQVASSWSWVSTMTGTPRLTIESYTSGLTFVAGHDPIANTLR